MREEEGPGCKRVGGPLRPDVLRVLLGQVYVGLLQDQHTPFIIIINGPKSAYGLEGGIVGPEYSLTGYVLGCSQRRASRLWRSAIGGYSHAPN